MDDRIRKWLVDIQMHIAEIEEFHNGNFTNFSEYFSNKLLKRATERNLEIIGEAVNRILKADKTFEKKISGSKSIIALRNQVIHSYDNITDEIIWSILINHLPKLKNEIDNLLKFE
ncbi:HepT-like ribonuclease domain-containing protein [Aequorivita echinoideorum]|uniref:DUF86 domain-containing protein n=1 Tax=Aequorivita echinoideorum TaxID=1549647 RepID=A0ABS5S4E5_9FLAO|nr:HepT-like ribonuclease domain-containing protein [Aequorivita echinoideorum]MBT0607848.1 DUF86 domain-containing protein [Aequorivita echinoideorum]